MSPTAHVYLVQYMYLDEATPRDVHTTTVTAVDEEEAKLAVWTTRQLAGDRVSVTSVQLTEEP